MGNVLRKLAATVALGALVAGPVVAANSAEGATAPIKVIPTPVVRSSLAVWQPLHTGQFLRSPNRVYEFVLQGDSNLVLYKDAVGKKAVALWASNTVGLKASYAVLQADGNFVVRTAKGKAIFTTRTARTDGVRIQVQNDGNVVIYTAKGKSTWSTRTEQRS